MTYYTFKVPADRGPDSWERYVSETVQLGPHETEGDAWESLRATIGDRADDAEIGPYCSDPAGCEWPGGCLNACRVPPARQPILGDGADLLTDEESEGRDVMLMRAHERYLLRSPEMLHFNITDNAGRYLGLVTLYDGMWSHSILSGGNNPFPFATREDAEADFWATKTRLSEDVHRIIFGHQLV